MSLVEKWHSYYEKISKNYYYQKNYFIFKLPPYLSFIGGYHIVREKKFFLITALYRLSFDFMSKFSNVAVCPVEFIADESLLVIHIRLDPLNILKYRIAYPLPYLSIFYVVRFFRPVWAQSLFPVCFQTSLHRFFYTDS